MKTKFKVDSLKPFIDTEGLNGSDEVERKQYTGEIKVIEGEERTIVARISTTDVDGDGDIIIPSGVDLNRFRANGVIHVDHSYKVEDVVGKAIEIGIDEKGIVAKIKFADTPRANDVWQLVSKGFVKANSIGFILKEAVYRGSSEFNAVVKQMGIKVADTCSRIVTKFELLESSIVSIPCNPAALVQAISAKSLDLSAKTIECLDLPAVVIVEKEVENPEIIANDDNISEKTGDIVSKDIQVLSTQEITPVETDKPEVNEVVEAEVVAEVKPAEVVVEVVSSRKISVVIDAEGNPVAAEEKKPERCITVIRNISVLRKGDIDVKAIAQKRIMAKRGKIL